MLEVHGFVNVDKVRDMDCKKIASGYVFNLFGGEISWMSDRKSIVKISTIEVEHMKTNHTIKEFLRLQRLCSGMGSYNKL